MIRDLRDRAAIRTTTKRSPGPKPPLTRGGRSRLTRTGWAELALIHAPPRERFIVERDGDDFVVMLSECHGASVTAFRLTHAGLRALNGATSEALAAHVDPWSEEGQ